MQFGCQTYIWQMSLERFRGQVPQILGAIRKAGFSGIEAETCVLADYYEQPEMLAEALKNAGIALGAICLVQPWREPTETPQEREEAETMFAFLRHFPETLLALGQIPGDDRLNLAERQKNAISCVNAVATRAEGRGIRCAFHANSAPGSIFRVPEDYEILTEGLDTRVVGLAPDAGHMAKGGLDVVRCFQDYRQIIRHVHFKDMSAGGQWVEMGKGTIDFPAIVEGLRRDEYQGWVMVEDECVRAETDPDGVTMDNGLYVRNRLNGNGK